jgi:hypothetical protein
MLTAAACCCTHADFCLFPQEDPDQCAVYRSISLRFVDLESSSRKAMSRKVEN